MLACGMDIGSTTGKVLLLREGRILGFSVVPCSARPDDTAEQALREAFMAGGLGEGDGLAYVVGTGYGRVSLSRADEHVSEITCHGKGAFYVNQSLRTVIDIGGQDCKVIRLNEKGKAVDFAMNDKCAAGTGRFYEAMARAMEVSLEQLAELSLKADKAAPITSQCSVFAESEVISLLSEGVPLAEIAAGIDEAVASRITSLVRKVGVREEVAVTGGCAKNRGLIMALERRLKVMVRVPDMDPQVIGALGAALIAEERLVQLEQGRSGRR